MPKKRKREKQRPPKEHPQREDTISKHDVDVKSETEPENFIVAAVFWLLVLFFPPAAIVWALGLPKKHPQKIMGLIAASVWLIILIMGGLSSQKTGPLESAPSTDRVPVESGTNESVDAH